MSNRMLRLIEFENSFPIDQIRYGNLEVDGQWQHWNHEILPHWNSVEAAKHPSKLRFDPPHEIHSPFYPLRGCYSSRDPNVTRAQFQELMRAGVGVVVLSWSGRPDVPGTHDTQGISTDALLSSVLDIAQEVLALSNPGQKWDR
jgi:glycoprotein endo-alpha-1,2-mannosidase